MMRLRLLAVLLSVLSAAAQQPAEKGKFRLHKFEQPIGEETYEIRRDGDSFSVKSDFKFTDRGSEVPLAITFRSAADYSPQSFEIKGKTSRISSIDAAVEVQTGKVRLRSRDQWTEAPAPARFFTISGYAPATMQMMMMRYWLAHGSPAELPTLPSGNVKVAGRGKDEVEVDGRKQSLERYSIEGLIWGRETIWLNDAHDLIAAVSTDAEFDHFEAVREGYESALPTFVAHNGADGMASLSAFSKTIPGSTASTLAIVGATLVDGTGRPAVPNATVVIDHGRIVAAGPSTSVKVPKNARKVDARGKTLLPGLWDMHAHFEQVEWGPIYLAAGVTTVRDCGNEFEFITAVRDAVAAGRGLGPRILAAGIVDGSGRGALGVARVDTPEQARQWVERYHDAGFQQMKLYNSVKLEQIKAVAEEAHRLGMTVTGHVPNGVSVYQAVEAGQDQVNHLHFILDMMLDLPPDARPAEWSAAIAKFDVNSPPRRRPLHSWRRITPWSIPQYLSSNFRRRLRPSRL